MRLLGTTSSGLRLSGIGETPCSQPCRCTIEFRCYLRFRSSVAGSVRGSESRVDNGAIFAEYWSAYGRYRNRPFRWYLTKENEVSGWTNRSVLSLRNLGALCT